LHNQGFFFQTSIRKRRMSKQRESLELPDPKTTADMANMGGFCYLSLETVTSSRAIKITP
jgi:hypothetical protein